MIYDITNKDTFTHLSYWLHCVNQVRKSVLLEKSHSGCYSINDNIDTRSGNILSFLLPLFQEGQLSVTGESNEVLHEVLVNHLGGLSLRRKSVAK